MGGCESCAFSRQKNLVKVQLMLRDSVRNGNLDDLRSAIGEAEACGIDTLAAREQYAELAKQERQSPETTQEMLKWAMTTQDGVVLHSVIQEVSRASPELPELPAAVSRLQELQDDAKLRLLQMSKMRSHSRSLTALLERSRQMGVPPEELHAAREALEEMQVEATGLPHRPARYRRQQRDRRKLQARCNC